MTCYITRLHEIAGVLNPVIDGFVCIRKHFVAVRPCVHAIDISYTLDGALHAVGRRKLKPDRRRWSLTRSMIICVFCIAEVDNKSI